MSDKTLDLRRRDKADAHRRLTEAKNNLTSRKLLDARADMAVLLSKLQNDCSTEQKAELQLQLRVCKKNVQTLSQKVKDVRKVSSSSLQSIDVLKHLLEQAESEVEIACTAYDAACRKHHKEDQDGDQKKEDQDGDQEKEDQDGDQEKEDQDGDQDLRLPTSHNDPLKLVRDPESMVYTIHCKALEPKVKGKGKVPKGEKDVDEVLHSHTLYSNVSKRGDAKKSKCNTCNAVVGDAKQYREHCKSDWHKHNLRRKTSQLPPLTADECMADLEISDGKADLKDYSF